MLGIYLWQESHFPWFGFGLGEQGGHPFVGLVVAAVFPVCDVVDGVLRPGSETGQSARGGPNNNARMMRALLGSRETAYSAAVAAALRAGSFSLMRADLPERSRR